MIIKIQSISYIDAQKLNPGFIRFFTIWCLGFNPEVFLIRNFLTFLTISSNETNLKAKIRHPILSVFLLIERMLDIYNWQTKKRFELVQVTKKFLTFDLLHLVKTQGHCFLHFITWGYTECFRRILKRSKKVYEVNVFWYIKICIFYTLR